MAGERVLTRRELNRALLARQLLLEPSDAPLPRVVERMGCVQAQYAPSTYVGLWTRMGALERSQVTEALERRTLVQATLMRITIHVASRRDYWPIALATREPRRASFLKSRRGRVDARGMAAAARTIASRLRASGSLHWREIVELVGRDRAQGVGLWLDMVRVPPSGTWERRRADLYAAAEAWLGPPDATAEEGTELLVRRYLGGFGPAAAGDIANWAGLPAKALVPVLERMRLRRFRDEDGAELLDLPRAPLPPADTPAPVRFLPTWDATLLVHARRTGILAEEHRARLFTSSNPQSESTFLVDGVVAGTWRHRDGRVELDPFERLDRDTMRALREEGGRLAAFQA